METRLKTTETISEFFADGTMRATSELRDGSGIIVATPIFSTTQISAPPVILIPGLGLSSRYLLPLAGCISRVCDVWILEVKRAAAPQSKACLDVAEAGSLIIKWMDMHGIASAILGGHSFGAQVVVEAAIQDHSKVRAVVLIAPTVDVSARTLVAQAWRLMHDAVREPFAAVRLALADYFRHPGNVFRMARAALADDIQSKLGAVRCPARVLCGSRDPVVPGNWARTLVALLPQGDLVTITGAAHALPLTHWQEVAAEIKACCSSFSLTCPRQSDATRVRL